MNTQITSAEEILKAAQKILLEHGASAAQHARSGGGLQAFPSAPSIIISRPKARSSAPPLKASDRDLSPLHQPLLHQLRRCRHRAARGAGRRRRALSWIFFAARAFLRQRRQSRRACAHGAAFQRPAWKIGGSAGKRHAHPRRRFPTATCRAGALRAT